MTDATDGAGERDEEASTSVAGEAPAAAGDPDADGGSGTAAEEADLDALRAAVEEKYDFDRFGPGDMAEMAPEEWEAAFDPDTWITGEALLERVEADLRTRVAAREVFARIERFDDVLVAYSDNGYAAVYPDGSVEGRGTVLRDVKPTVALCSMDSYEVADPPTGETLPSPEEVPERSDVLGNTVLQIVGGVMLVAGVVLLAAVVLSVTGLLELGGVSGGPNLVLVLLAGLGFLVVGVFLFVTVANARLSDRYRAAEYRDRLRAVGLADGERPAFLAEIEGVDIEHVAGPGLEGDGERSDPRADSGTEPQDHPGEGGEDTAQEGDGS